MVRERVPGAARARGPAVRARGPEEPEPEARAVRLAEGRAQAAPEREQAAGLGQEVRAPGHRAGAVEVRGREPVGQGPEGREAQGPVGREPEAQGPVGQAVRVEQGPVVPEPVARGPELPALAAAREPEGRDWAGREVLVQAVRVVLALVEQEPAAGRVPEARGQAAPPYGTSATPPHSRSEPPR